MTDWNKIRASAARLLEQPGLTVVVQWGDLDLRAVKSVRRREDVNTDAGLIDGNYSLSILVPVVQLEGREPNRRNRDKMVVDGVTYRVIGTETDAVNAIMRIDLGDPRT